MTALYQCPAGSRRAQPSSACPFIECAIIVPIPSGRKMAVRLACPVTARLTPFA